MLIVVNASLKAPRNHFVGKNTVHDNVLSMSKSYFQYKLINEEKLPI